MVPSDFGLGLAGGGVAVFVVVVPVVVRRRRYERADREGRVVVEAPPVPSPPTAAEPLDQDANARGSKDVATSSDPTVRVGVLGPVVFEGLRADIALTPVRELLVFLATHPGRRFTSAELRTAIWVEGRDQPKPATFRNHLSRLRKALPEGALVSEGTRTRLTDLVASDWARFEALLGRRGDERRRDLEDALSLVRGRPFESAFEGRNSPYAWTTELVHLIEANVEAAGHELAQLYLESGDLTLADRAVDQGLLAVPSSLVLLEDRLRVGAATGGPKEVARRLEVAAARLGADTDLLGAVAVQLGVER